MGFPLFDLGVPLFGLGGPFFHLDVPPEGVLGVPIFDLGVPNEGVLGVPIFDLGVPPEANLGGLLFAGGGDDHTLAALGVEGFLVAAVGERVCAKSSSAKASCCVKGGKDFWTKFGGASFGVKVNSPLTCWLATS